MGHRALGAAVIGQAFHDASRTLFLGEQVGKYGTFTGKVIVRSEVAAAIAYLCEPSADLHFWCEIAGMPMSRIVREARRRLAAQRGQLKANADRLHYTAAFYPAAKAS